MANRVQVELGAKVEGFVDGMNKASESAKQYETDTRKVKDSLGNFRKEFAQAKKDVMNLASAYSKLDATARASQFGQEMAKQLDAAKQKASEMLDMQGDLNQELKNMASDTRVFDTLAEGMGVFMTTTASALGVVAQFTGNEEDARKAVVAFTTAQSVLQTATKIQNALQKQSNIMLAIGALQNKAAAAAATLKAAAETRGAAATKAATVAQAAFNTVAKANPYVLLATAILGVAAALGAYMYASKKARTEAEAAEKQAKKNREYHEALNTALGDSLPTFMRLQAEWKSLKTTAEKTQWIEKNKSEFDKLGVAVNNVTDAENVLIKNSSAVVRAMLLRAEAAAKAAMMQKQYEKMLEAQTKLEGAKGRKLDAKEVQDLIDSGVNPKYIKQTGGWNRFNREYEVDVDRAVRNMTMTWTLNAEKLAKESADATKKANDTIAEKSIQSAGKATKTATSKTKEIIKGSVEEAENELNKAQDKLKKIDVSKAGSDKLIKQTQEEIKRWEKELKDRKMKVEIELTANATEYLKKYEDVLKAEEERARAALIIAKLNKADAATIAKCVEELNKATNARQSYEKVAKSINQTQADILSEYEKELKTQEDEAAAALVLAHIHHNDANEIVRLTDEWEKAAKARKDYEATKKAVTGEDPTATANKKYGAIMSGETPKTVKDYQDAINTLQDRLNSIDTTKSQEEFTKITDKIKEMQSELNNMQDYIKEGLETPAEKAAKKAARLADRYDLIADAVASVGDAFSALSELAEDDPALQVMSIVAQAVANMFAGYAQATVQAAQMGPWAWVAFAAAGLAQTLAMVAQIKSAAQFTEGGYMSGIVGGSSYHGDRINARLNSGEMVLNQHQQKNLFDLLDQDVLPQKGGTNVTVTGVVRGTDLLLVQKNTNKVRSKAGTQISF